MEIEEEGKIFEFVSAELGLGSANDLITDLDTTSRDEYTDVFKEVSTLRYLHYALHYQRWSHQNHIL